MKYHLSKAGLDKNWSKIVRNDMVVTQQFVDEINENTKQNGFAMIVNEEKTEEYYKQREAQEIAKTEAKEIEKALAVDVLQKATKTSIDMLNENVKQLDEVKKSRKKM